MKINETLTGNSSRAARIVSAAVVSLFVFTGLLYAPLGAGQVYASDYEQWEDCDWDGYDDHTGVEVPWPGFDGTRGDTPAGPSPDSQTGKKKAAEEAAKKAAEEAAKKKAAEEEAKKKAAAGSDSTKEKSSKSSSSSSKKKSSSSGSEKDSDAASADETAAEDVNADADEEATSAAVKTTKGAVTTTAPAVSAEDALAAAQAASDAAIVAQKGVVEVDGAEEGALHAGSVIVVRGAGFAPDVEALDVEIRSDPVRLGTVATDASGAFEAEFTLPEDLPEGSHSVVVAYKGADITSNSVEVGPAPAGGLWGALTAGFGSGEFPAGIVILIVIAVAAAAVLGIGAIRRRKKGAGRADAAA
jgi:hypothetical protein